MSSIKIKVPDIGPKIKVEVIHNVVQIESEECVTIQIKRGDKLEQYQETVVCQGKCPKCGEQFFVYFKKSQIKCPECFEYLEGKWSQALMNTWGNHE